MSERIRHARVGDAEALHAILTSPHVVRGTMRLPYMPLESKLKRLAYDRNRLQIVSCGYDTLTGFAELLLHRDIARSSHAAELNLVVVRHNYLRAGTARLMTNALMDLCDTMLGIHRIQLTVWSDNSGVSALYEQLGFVKEGVILDYVCSSTGGLSDAVLIARIRGDV